MGGATHFACFAAAAITWPGARSHPAVSGLTALRISFASVVISCSR